MASRVPVYSMSVDEYLEAEKTASVRHEYVAGQIYAMAGASDWQTRLAGTRLKCTVFGDRADG